MDPLFLKAALLSGGAVLLILFIAWWLYLSQMKRPVEQEKKASLYTWIIH